MKPTNPTTPDQPTLLGAELTTSTHSESTWITLKEARALTGRGKTTIRNWLQTGDLPSRKGEGETEVPHDMLMALHESKPHSSAKKSNRPFEPHTAQSDVSTMPTADLRPHPLSSQIYGVTHDSRLLESVKETGILSPLLVTANGMVVSGGERLWAARESGLAEVPVRLVPTLDETDIKLQVLAANIARDKTNEQRIREYQFYQEIE